MINFTLFASLLAVTQNLGLPLPEAFSFWVASANRNHKFSLWSLFLGRTPDCSKRFLYIDVRSALIAAVGIPPTSVLCLLSVPHLLPFSQKAHCDLLSPESIVLDFVPLIGGDYYALASMKTEARNSFFTRLIQEVLCFLHAIFFDIITSW